MKQKKTNHSLLFTFLGLAWSLVLLLILNGSSVESSSKKEQNALHILCWGDYFDKETLELFEKSHGIHIALHTYSSTSELLSKIRNTGTSDYDLIFTSDDAMRFLKEEGFLAPLPKLSLPSFAKVMDIPFDLEGKYILPYTWEGMGIGVDLDQMAMPENHSLEMIFDPTYSRIGMTSDFIEAICIASTHLYKDKEELTDQELTQVKKLLIEQKKRTIAYSDHKAMSLLATHSSLITTLRSSYYVQMLLNQTSNIGYFIPKEALFISIEGVALTVTTPKKDSCKQFLEFIYQPEIVAKQIMCCPLFPCNLDAYNYIENGASIQQIAYDHINAPNKRLFKRLVSSEKTMQTWIEVKASNS